MFKKMKKFLALSLAVATVMSMSMMSASATESGTLADGTYTITANLYVPESENTILGKDAYLTTESTLPTSPTALNATLTVDGDDLSLSVPIVNTTFALLDLGTTDDLRVDNIVTTTTSFWFSQYNRIDKITMDIEYGATGIVFTDCTELATILIYWGEKDFGLQLDVDWDSVVAAS